MTFAKNKYRGTERDAYYAELEEELKNYGKPSDDEANEEVSEPAKPREPTEPSGDGTDWKKRYADLQRHVASLEKKWDGKEKEFARELEAAKQKASLPANLTPEKLSEWEKKFPDVAAIIDHRAKEIAKQMSTSLEEKVGNLEKSNTQMEQERAIMQLLSIHEDFLEIRDSDQFTDWLANQPESFADAIYKPVDFSSKSVDAAAKVVRFFKLDTGWGSDKKTKEKPKKDTSAAESVSRGGPSLPDDAEGQPEFSESQVSKMSDKEFEANMDKIQAAQRSGRFLYDLTGAAQ